MWFVEALRHTPVLAVFLTIGLGFWLGSSVPALGYTITYAVSNTVLIIFGIVLVLLTA